MQMLCCNKCLTLVKYAANLVQKFKIMCHKVCFFSKNTYFCGLNILFVQFNTYKWL